MVGSGKRGVGMSFWQCRRCDQISESTIIPKQCTDCKFKFFRLCNYPKSGWAEEQEIRVMRDNILKMIILKQKDDATELIVKKLQEITRFYATRFDEKNEIYYYEEGIYKPNGKTFIKEFCRQILKEVYTEQLANRITAKIEADNYIDQEKLLKRHYQYKIAVENGILDLKTREIEPFIQEKIFLAKTPIKYDPQAQCPEIRKFFLATFPSENDIKTIEELFGYCLSGGYPIQKIALFIGGGGNGKGQTLDLLRTFLGENNYSGIPLQKLQDNDFKEVNLFNKFANIGAEISDNPLKETSKIKGLSGGDSISASVKFKNDLIFVNEAKLIFSANKLPKTYDLTEGFFRRWVYIVFPYRFLTQKEYENSPQEIRENCKIRTEEIVQKIITPEELSGLLNIALDGLDRLLKNADFTTSTSSDETKQWWIRNSDSFLAFCWENIEEAPDGWIGKKELRKQYGKFCTKNKLIPEGDKHIHEVMIRQINAWEDQDSNTGERAWNGIRFKVKKPEESKINTQGKLEADIIYH
jgi:putative DNA primase/helicase